MSVKMLLPAPEGVREWLTAQGFKPETAYMEVPRCDQCKHWRPTDSGPIAGDMGRCTQFDLYDAEPIGGTGVWISTPFIETKSGFGCVEWEAKL